MYSFCTIFIFVMYHIWHFPFSNNAKCLIGTEVIYVHYYMLIYSYLNNQPNNSNFTRLVHLPVWIAIKFKLLYTFFVSHAYVCISCEIKYCPRAFFNCGGSIVHRMSFIQYLSSLSGKTYMRVCLLRVGCINLTRYQ